MNRIIVALAALVGSASAFAPAVAPRPATQLQASKFDAGAKADALPTRAAKARMMRFIFCCECCTNR